jgi:hypothetical protein
MTTRIDMKKVDYSTNTDILKELYSGERQIVEAKWDDFLQIPVNDGYQANKTREVDFNQMKDICGNDITVTVVENGIQQPNDNK